MISECWLHLISSNLDQNINQKWINRLKAGCNLDAIVTESEIHLITSKFDQNINQMPDQQIKNYIKTRYNSDPI